jgi:hypothetical protein
MTVINEPISHNIDVKIGNSDALMVQKNIIEEKDMSCSAKCKEPDDEDSFCFVLGYN